MTVHSFSSMLPLKLMFTVLAGNDTLRKSDAIVLLEGDNYARVNEAHRLFRDGWAKTVVISGGIDNAPARSIPARLLKRRLVACGVPEKNIVLEEKSLNTREQAVAVMRMVRVNGWKRIIVVASPYHQFRAYLTFIKAMRDDGLKIVISNAPARDLSWFEQGGDGLSRVDLLDREFQKIKKYKKDLVSFTEAIRYHQWKEKQ